MKNYHYTLLAILILLNFFIPLGMFPLFDLNEGVFAEATREMFVNDDFIVPYLNGELRVDKPILIYWLQALSMKVFGFNEFGVRLPSALFATVWALALFYFTRRVLDEKSAFFATFFMVSSLHISIIAKAAMTESILNAFVALAMFSLYFYIRTQKTRYLLFLSLFAGLGFLTKGPIAVFIPLATGFTYYLLKRDLKTFFKILVDYRGIALFLAVVLPWFIAIYIEQGDKFIKGFFLKHNIERFQKTMEHHGGSLFYYIPVILLGFLPYTTLLVRLFAKTAAFLKERDGLFLFAFLWFFVVFVFFSLASTKQAHYIIYGYTPLFMLMGYLFVRYEGRYIRFYALPYQLFLFLLLLLPFVGDYLVTHTDKESTKIIIQSLRPYFGYDYYLLILAALVLLAFRFDKELKTFIMGFSMVLIINFELIPIYSHLFQIPIKKAARYVKEHNIKDVTMKMRKFSFNFYAKTFTKSQNPKPGDIALVKVTDLKKFKNYNILFKEGMVALVKLN